MKRCYLLLSAAVMLIGANSTAVAQSNWNLAAGYPIGNPHTVTLNQFVKDVELATNGKIKITVHANGSLFKVPEIARAVESGQAQMGEILMSVMVNQNPVFGVDSLPFLATGFDDAYKLWQAQKPVADRLLAKRGAKLLYAVAWPPQGIYAKKELGSGAAKKGLTL